MIVLPGEYNICDFCYEISPNNKHFAGNRVIARYKFAQKILHNPCRGDPCGRPIMPVMPNYTDYAAKPGDRKGRPYDVFVYFDEKCVFL